MWDKEGQRREQVVSEREAGRKWEEREEEEEGRGREGENERKAERKAEELR